MTTMANNINSGQLNAVCEGFLPGYLGIIFSDIGTGFALAELPIRKDLIAHDAALGRYRKTSRHWKNHRALSLHTNGAMAEVTLQIYGLLIG